MYCLSQTDVGIGDTQLLHELSLDFPAHHLCMIVGPNGAGKTTLLRTLAGDITPTTGTIDLDGKSLADWSIRELALSRAVLPQHSSLDFPFSVLDVVLMGRLPHPTDGKTNREIAIEMLQCCDCHHLAERSFPTLSGGEQQRVQIARVLAQIWWEPASSNRYLLLDEPVSALDLSHQHQLLEQLRNLTRQKGLGVICTLHNLNLAAQFADRCLILDSGRVVADGMPAEVFTVETLRRVFGLDMWIQPHPQDSTIPLIVPKLTSSNLPSGRPPPGRDPNPFNSDP